MNHIIQIMNMLMLFCVKQMETVYKINLRVFKFENSFYDFRKAALAFVKGNLQFQMSLM